MRLLLANPNTTAAVTDRVAQEARRAASPGTEIVAVTAGFGVAVVSTEAENAVAAHAALDLIAANYEAVDAAIIAMSFDTGVAAARPLLPIPVVGITEAALHVACLAGERFGLVILGAASLPLYLALLDRTGLRGRMAACEAVAVDSIGAYLDDATLERGVAEAAVRLAARPDVDVVVLCGSAVAGIARRIQPAVPAPLVDSIGAAVAQAELLVGMGLAPKRRPRSLAADRPAVGLSPALQRLLQGGAP